MSVPSLEAVKITNHLLDKYKYEENIEDVLKLDYNFQTPEDLLREHFAQQEYPDDLQDEVTELFFKISKFRKYLTAIEKEFLNEKSSLHLVLLYLLIIEMNEYSKPQIEELIINIKDHKILLLLSLLKRSDTVKKLYELGIQIWDIEYVKEVLQNVVKKTLFQEVYETVANHKRKLRKNQKKELTVPTGPKCLNYPRKLQPTSEIMICPPPSMTRIPIMIRANGIPGSTYTRPIQIENIEKACQIHREEARRKYQEAQKNAFRCANIEKSVKCKKLIEEMEKDEPKIPVRKISWSKIKSKEVQHPKKTAAVILREGARLLKLEQEEIKRYEDLACGGFNNDLLAEWEKEIREETFQKHIEDIEKKHLEGLLSYEDALIAKQKCLQKKKEIAAEVKMEKENWLNQLEMWRKEEQIRIQESFERGKAYEKGMKEAVEHSKEEKRKVVLEIMEESKILKERWLKEKEQDLQRKVQLIKEIKALQAIGVIRRKQTDFTETANLGLLYEMSLAELKERLFILKMELQEELERRRAEVKMKRECRKDIINSYQELIESHQKIMQEQKQKAKCEVENEEIKKKTRPIRSSSSLDILRQKLCEKRMERIKHQINRGNNCQPQSGSQSGFSVTICRKRRIRLFFKLTLIYLLYGKKIT